MANVTLGELLTLLFTDLAKTVQQTADQAALKLQVTDLDLDIPAYLRLQEAGPDPEEEPARLVLTLPSTRESPSVGGLGRVTVTIGVKTLDAQAQTPPPEEP
jgi:hypothetical protein